MDGIKYRSIAPRYIPFPTPPAQQLMLDAKKRGVDAIGKKIETSKLKAQQPVQQRSF